MNKKTVTTIFYDGNPNGRMIYSVSNWNGIVYKIPRILFKEQFDNHYLSHAGIYILLGKDDDNEDKYKVYIGEAENLLDRGKQHLANEQKNFFTDVILLTTIDNSLNKAHIKFIENKLYDKAIYVNRDIVINKCTPAKAKITIADEILVNGFIETCLEVISFIGCKTFENINAASKRKIIKKSKEKTTSEILYCRGGKEDWMGYAEAEILTNGFMIHAGAKFRKNPVEDLEKTDINVHNRRIKLLSNTNLFKEYQQYYELLQDYDLKTPTGAARLILGKSQYVIPGKIWKNKKGIALSKLKKGKNND